MLNEVSMQFNSLGATTAPKSAVALAQCCAIVANCLDAHNLVELRAQEVRAAPIPPHSPAASPQPNARVAREDSREAPPRLSGVASDEMSFCLAATAARCETHPLSAANFS